MIVAGIVVVVAVVAALVVAGIDLAHLAKGSSFVNPRAVALTDLAP